MSDQAAGGGRTRITARALERVTAAVAADAFGGGHGDRVKVDLTDADGALDIRIATAIRSVSLARAAEAPESVARSGGSIVDRAAEAESTIRDRVQTLTGSTVRRVAVHITGITTSKERRVR